MKISIDTAEKLFKSWKSLTYDNIGFDSVLKEWQERGLVESFDSVLDIGHDRCAARLSQTIEVSENNPSQVWLNDVINKYSPIKQGGTVNVGGKLRKIYFAGLIQAKMLSIALPTESYSRLRQGMGNYDEKTWLCIGHLCPI